MSSSFEEAPLIQKPGNNNRLLIEDPSMEEEEKESGFLRSGGKGSQMSGFGMPQKRNLAPLIEEEDDAQQKPEPRAGNVNIDWQRLADLGMLSKERKLALIEEEDQVAMDVLGPKSGQGAVAGGGQSDLAWSLGLPKLQQQKRNRDARRAYNTLMHNKASANPWTKTGQRTQANVAGMFGERSAKIPFFEKLFGAPAGNFRSKDRAARQAAELEATGKTVGNQKVRATGIGGAFKRFAWRWKNRNNTFGDHARPKMSWMQRLFGARRPKAETAKAMGIKSPKGRWADQLIDQGEAGLLGEGAENFSGPIEEQKQGQEPAHQSFEHYDGSVESEEEEKGTGNKGMFGGPLLGLGNQKLIAGLRQSNEYGGPQQNEYGDGNGTVDDNSIDNDDDKDDYKDAYDKGMLQAYMNKNDDDDASDNDDESVDGDQLQKFIMNNMF